MLDMLKEEEFINFIRGTKTKQPAVADRAELSPREAELYKEYNELTRPRDSSRREYDQLLAKTARTAEENQRLKDLTAQLQDANQAFRNYLNELAKALAASDEIKRPNKDH